MRRQMEMRSLLSDEQRSELLNRFDRDDDQFGPGMGGGPRQGKGFGRGKGYGRRQGGMRWSLLVVVYDHIWYV